MADIVELEVFDICSNHIGYEMFKQHFVFNDKHYIDYTWIKAQMEYINNLSDREKHILRAYTIYGDRFINNYVRNNITAKDIHILIQEMIHDRENVFLYQQQDVTGPSLDDPNYIANVITYIPLFIEELNRIIHKSPPLTREIVVFRGIKNRQYFDNESSRKILYNNEFISTSMYLPSATTNSFTNDSCCLFEMKLIPGTPCIFTADISRRRGEYEITLASGIKHDIVYKSVKFLLNQPEYYENTDVFIDPLKYNVSRMNVTVTESIVE